MQVVIISFHYACNVICNIRFIVSISTFSSFLEGKNEYLLSYFQAKVLHSVLRIKLS